MDTLTHALSGALAARISTPHQPRIDQLPQRQRLWVGFWCAAFPDSDFLLRFYDPLYYLLTHRGVTHSLVLLPLWTTLLAGVFFYLWRRRYPYRAYLGVCALALTVHIVGDVITSYGTMILAPLSDYRLSLSTTFIIDPLVTGIIVLGLLGTFMWTQTRRPALLAGLTLLAYIGLQAHWRQQALAVANNRVGEQPAAKITVLPQPFAPVHWLLVITTAESHEVARVNLMRQNPIQPPSANASWWRRIIGSYRAPTDLSWHKTTRYGENPADQRLARAAWESEALAHYRRFALLPALEAIDRHGAGACVWFYDIRFALLGRDTPFRYGACRGNKQSWQLKAYGDRLLNPS